MKGQLTRGHFETAVDLRPRELRMLGECAGAAVPFDFEGTAYSLCFPNFEFRKDGGSDFWPVLTFGHTDVMVDWPREQGDWANFGRAHHWISTEVLGFYCDHLVVRTQHEVSTSNADGLAHSLERWQELFTSWFEILNGVDLASRSTANVTSSDRHPSYEGYLTSGTDFWPMQDEAVRVIRHRMDRLRGVAADLAKVTDTLRRAATGEPPPLTYWFLLYSRRHLQADRYREAVLDAATALELALVSLCQRELGDPKSKRSMEFFEHHRMLGGLYYGAWECLKLDLAPQESMRTALGKPRNDAMHKGAKVSEKNAQAAYNFARDTITKHLPL